MRSEEIRNEREKTKKPSAAKAWAMLIGSLPKGIAAFVTMAASLSVSLPLSVFIVGLPLLAETLVLCGRLMEAERLHVRRWRYGEMEEPQGTAGSTEQWQGWRALLSVLIRGRSYRALGYSLLQLPVGIVAFTLAFVLPVAAWALMLAPLAQQVSVRLYKYDLFAQDHLYELLSRDYLTGTRFADMTPDMLSWVYGGIGLVFVLLLPAVLRALGRLYAAWIQGIAGAEPESAAVVTPSNEPRADYMMYEWPAEQL